MTSQAKSLIKPVVAPDSTIICTSSDLAIFRAGSSGYAGNIGLRFYFFNLSGHLIKRHPHAISSQSVRWSADSSSVPAPRNNTLLPCAEHRARERFRYMLGVIPQKRLKCRAKWLWSKNPTSAATTDPGMPASSKACARSIRSPHKYR